MPRDLLGGFKNKEEDKKLGRVEQATAAANSASNGGQGVGGGGQPQQQGMGAAPVTGGFVNFDRMLGLNREKVNTTADRLQSNATGKVSSAADAYGKAKQNFGNAVNAGTSNYYANKLTKDFVGGGKLSAGDPNAPPGSVMAGPAVTRAGDGLMSTPTKGVTQTATSAEARPDDVGTPGGPMPTKPPPPNTPANNLLKGFKPANSKYGVGQQFNPATSDAASGIGGQLTPYVRNPAPQSREELAAAAARGYSGPEDISTADGWQDALKTAGAADSTLNNIGNAGGIATELGYSTPEGGALSGSAALDSGLVQGAAGGRLSELSKRYGSLTKDLGSAVDASKGIADVGRRTSADAQAKYGRDLAAFDALDPNAYGLIDPNANNKTPGLKAMPGVGGADSTLGFEDGSYSQDWSEGFQSPDGWSGGQGSANKAAALESAGLTVDEAVTGYTALTQQQKAEADAVGKQAGGVGTRAYLTAVAQYIASKKKKGGK
jgi:hypothetical protein